MFMFWMARYSLATADFGAELFRLPCHPVFETKATWCKAKKGDKSIQSVQVSTVQSNNRAPRAQEAQLAPDTRSNANLKVNALSHCPTKGKDAKT